MVENPWPEFTKAKRRTIKTILMEQGSGVEERTEGAIKFNVYTSFDGPGSFRHLCDLRVISIDYDYPLFTVTHPASMFPVTTIADALGQPVVSHNEEELVAVLKQIIMSDQTRIVVEQLLDAVV